MIPSKRRCQKCGGEFLGGDAISLPDLCDDCKGSDYEVPNSDFLQRFEQESIKSSMQPIIFFTKIRDIEYGQLQQAYTLLNNLKTLSDSEKYPLKNILSSLKDILMNWEDRLELSQQQSDFGRSLNESSLLKRKS